MKRQFKYEFGRHTASIHGLLPGEPGHSETRIFDTYDYMMRGLRGRMSVLDDDLIVLSELNDRPIMSRSGWDE